MEDLLKNLVIELLLKKLPIFEQTLKFITLKTLKIKTMSIKVLCVLCFH